MKPVFLSIFLLYASHSLKAQATSQKVPATIISFFTGEWHGGGKFANGKTISANASFTISLDSSWLIENHEDIPPNKYKAVSMWGIDPANSRFIAFIFDNNGGHRKFYSDGWQAGKLVLSTKEYVKGRGNVFEHFIYEEKSNESFKMTFEVSRDGTTWKLIDSLMYRKVNPKEK